MRVEVDSLGSVKIPDGVYWGASTKRTLDAFRISGQHVPAELLRAYAMIKKAAALANGSLGALDDARSRAIVQACDEVIAGRFADQFPIDVFQPGAGTATNMNLNEVLASRATEILGHKIGGKFVHPNDHVNMSQSTNDTYHCAAHIAACMEISSTLLPSLGALEKSLSSKSRQFGSVLKSGRTHLKDAVPMALGQEFSGFAVETANASGRIKNSMKSLLVLNIGGTAIGTGLNAQPKYPELAIKHINSMTGLRFIRAKNLFHATQSVDALLEASSALRSAAVGVSSISGNLRLMSSGPATGFDEISLPAVIPGSSIMPGKVNPSIPEMASMVCFQVIGNDTAITHAAAAGQFELNVMMPLIAHNLLHSIKILSNSSMAMASCISGIKANQGKMLHALERNPVAATALAPHIGYDEAAKVVKESYLTGKSIRQIVLEKKLMAKDKLDRILDFKKMAGI